MPKPTPPLVKHWVLRSSDLEQPEVVLPDTLIGEMQAEFDMDLFGD